MLLLLLKSSACLAILLLFYKQLLEATSVHKFKRFYLLAVIGIAVGFPLITFIEYIEPEKVLGSYQTFSTTFPTIQEEIIEEPTNYWPIILWSIYGLGTLLFALKFVLNFTKLILQIKQNPKYKSNRFINVLVQDLIVPHTFLNYIFLNKAKFETQQIPKEVLLHEQTHAKQKHSLDILFLELLQIIFWFNPLIYLLKKEVKLNHEFLADAEVIKQGAPIKNYQHILLAFSSNTNEHQLANAINYSSIKKRFTLMKTKTSKKTIGIRTLLLLPLLGGLLFSFSTTKQVKEEVKPTMEIEKPKEVSNQIVENDFNKSLAYPVMYIIDKNEYYKNSTFKFIDKDKNIIAVKKFSELTAQEKENLPKPPSKPMKKIPTEKNLNDWKDVNKFGVWLDGKKIENSKLDNYKASDFSLYLVSKLEKNAVNYGKHIYQLDLYSNEKFDELYEKDMEPLSESSVISIMVSNNIQQDGATRKEIAEYNALAKKYNATGHKMIIKREVERLQYIYRKMSVVQRKIAEPFPVFPPPPPAPESPTSSMVRKGDVSNIPPPPPPAPVSQYHTQKQLPTINGIVCDYCELFLSKNDASNLIVGTNTNEKIKSFKIKFSGKPTETIKDVKLNDKAKTFLDESNIDDVFQIFDIKTTGGKLPPIIITIVDEKNKTGFLDINGKKHWFVTNKGKTKYYNRFGIEVDKKGNEVNGSKQVDGDKVIPGQNITKIYQNNKVVSEFKKTWSSDDEMEFPKMPEPKSTLDHIIDMSKKGATFYYNGDEITSDEAIALAKTNSKLNISSQTNNGVSTVHLSEKGMTIINGKMVKDKE